MKRRPQFDGPDAGTRVASTLSLQVISDHRGKLLPLDPAAGVPFEVRRAFVVFDVPNGMVRGGHAHRRAHQLLVCLRGAVRCEIDDGECRSSVLLDSPNAALHIPPWIWAEQCYLEPGATLLVLASEGFREDEYVRDYSDFLSLVAARCRAEDGR
jgi:UDP-2-acetamido-3-amino-2,3-dideoxy-glucuronate N-acetyltransferase